MGEEKFREWLSQERGFGDAGAGLATDLGPPTTRADGIQGRHPGERFRPRRARLQEMRKMVDRPKEEDPGRYSKGIMRSAGHHVREANFLTHTGLVADRVQQLEDPS